jgi:hypothetical protein
MDGSRESAYQDQHPACRLIVRLDFPGPLFIRELPFGIAIERLKSSNFDWLATTTSAVPVCASRGWVEFYLAPALINVPQVSMCWGANCPQLAPSQSVLQS